MRHKAASGFREDSGLGALVEGHQMKNDSCHDISGSYLHTE